MTLKILHFADAHIDIAAHGRHDPVSGLPLRVLDFLQALDSIVDAAINERVDLVIFAGDAYRDRTPAPTFQREWGRRMMRLSGAGIPTLLLVGNHDISPASGRAHTLQEFDTLQVPNVLVLDKPSLLGPDQLWGLPLHLIALPWVHRSSLMANLDLSGASLEALHEKMEERIRAVIEGFVAQVEDDLPLVLTAHTTVQGAVFGGERSVMLGADLVLPGSLVRDPRLDYVALGHIHKAQDLNEGQHPPVIYPGSIERVDYGEAGQEKFFVIAHVARGSTRVEWRKLEGRRFIERSARINSAEGFMEKVLAALPEPAEMEDAMLRLKLEYPRELEPMLDEPALREAASAAFEFRLVRQPRVEARIRLPAGQGYSSLGPLDLLDQYLVSVNTPPEERTELHGLASHLLRLDEDGAD